jgi:hypothetical protein
MFGDNPAALGRLHLNGALLPGDVFALEFGRAGVAHAVTNLPANVDQALETRWAQEACSDVVATWIR